MGIEDLKREMDKALSELGEEVNRLKSQRNGNFISDYQTRDLMRRILDSMAKVSVIRTMLNDKGISVSFTDDFEAQYWNWYAMRKEA